MNPHMSVCRVLYELDQHPALASHSMTILQLLDLDIMEIGKNGKTRPFRGRVPVRYSPQNYNRFKKEFDKEFKKYTPEELDREKRLILIYNNFEKVYGARWEFDHVEYWGELPFMMFTGDNIKDYHLRENWSTYQRVTASGRTFKEMIVNLGRKFFRSFGKFDIYDFRTSKEKDNNKKEEPFLPSGVDEKRSITNPMYISVLNLRWVKWFSKTNLGKKWEDDIKEVLKKHEL